jgi:putative ABC transport system permease protein
MSDLKDTHYLDSIWFTYQTPEYEQLEQSVRTITATQHKCSQTDHQAVGAHRRYILLQFLAEALTITFIGGVLGVVPAYVVALSAGRLTLYSAFAKNGEAGDIRLIIAPGTLIASTLILDAVGLISGMVPALRASRLDPIEALRHE